MRPLHLNSMNEFKPIGVDAAINMLAMLFGEPYIIPGDNETQSNLGRFNVTVKEADKYDRLSQFGTPVLGTFWAVADDLPYLVYNANDKLVEREFLEFEFPIATIVDFSRPKFIKKENTIGGKGSVKEIMGIGDWDITIRGLLVDDDSRTGQKTAKQQQHALDMLNEIAGAIKIKGKVFEERYISHIVIETPRYYSVQGKPGLIQYEMRAFSDESFILTGV